MPEITAEQSVFVAAGLPARALAGLRSNPLEKDFMTAPRTHLFDARLHFISTVEYGYTRADVAVGKPIPEEGVRFDMFFEGYVRGEQINGRISGIDYVTLGPDGVSQLHVHGHIVTDDGSHVAVHAHGQARRRPDSVLADTQETLSFSTAIERYSWLNHVEATATGLANLETGMLDISVACEQGKAAAARTASRSG